MATSLQVALRAFFATAIIAASMGQASAQQGRKVDPDWPCPQTKTSTFSLASVWAGPQLDLASQSWRDDEQVADLAERMWRRRVPISEVEKEIANFKAQAGTDAESKLLRAFAAAFDELSQQRSQIIAGLDRFGREQGEMAKRIRAEAEEAEKAGDQNQAAQTQPGADAQGRLQWDLRVYDERRQTIHYVCETPMLIEQRIGAIARAVQSTLPQTQN